MATKIIKAWVNGSAHDVEVGYVTSPEQPLSVEERVDTLEGKHEVVITEGNFLVGNGTEDMEEITPSEVLSHINGASVATMTTAEFEALEETNANTLYMLTDGEEDGTVLYTEQSLTEEQKAQARVNIGVGESIASTLMALDIVSEIVDDDNGILIESDGTIIVTRNDDIFLPECTDDDNGKFLRVSNGVATWQTVLNAEEVAF